MGHRATTDEQIVKRTARNIFIWNLGHGWKKEKKVEEAIILAMTAIKMSSDPDFLNFQSSTEEGGPLPVLPPFSAIPNETLNEGMLQSGVIKRDRLQ